MDLINIKHTSERVSFREAVLQGLGRGQGLFFPQSFETLPDVPDLLQEEFVSRSATVLGHLIGDEIDASTLQRMVTSAFDFPLEVPALDDRVHALELFHGPSLAFKDFGARFMARCLAEFHDGGPMTILTATSGDTGAAVAHAYYQQPGIDVVILYPKGKISPLQEKLFCTLGGNVRTIAVDSDFDTCQQLVKQSFDDPELKQGLGLNSANSINIARLMAQVCYYFEAGAVVNRVEDLVLSVPSGNFGNVTAGLVARCIGLPYKRIVAATNINDTVPRFFASGHWDPNPTITTITNAMDISLPNNFPRVLELGERHGLPLAELLTPRGHDRRGAGVEGDHSVAEHPAVGADRGKRLSLRGDADPPDRIARTLRDGLPDHLPAGRGDLRRIDFRPAALRGEDGILAVSQGQQPPLGVEDARFRSGGADVQSEVAQGRFSVMWNG